MTAKNSDHNYSISPSTISDEELRKKAEDALRESEERYRDLVENATDLICTHDLKGRLLSVNAAAAGKMGFAVEEIVGLRIPDLLPEDRRHEFNDYIKAIQRDGTAAGTIKVVTRNGDVRYWGYRNTLRTDGVPEPVVRGMARDVTGEVLAKRALKKSEKRYRLLFERNLAGIYRTTIDGKIIDCNDAFARIYGYESSREAMQRPAADLYPSLKARQEFIDTLKERGMLLDFESQKRRKDGSSIWLLENASLVPGEDGELTEIEGMLIDITERKKMEEELLKADKLESVGVLAGGIAHDFNNILTTVLGNISLAKMQVKPGSKISGLLDAAEKASIRAQGLTRQLLTFAKGGVPVKETASISRLIEESSLIVLQGSKSGCEFSIAEDLWPVEADAGQISQVISNIVINANQAMPEGGIIRITADNLVLEEGHLIQVKPGRYIRISIKDQGTGIAEKDLLKIFDPYFTTKNEGSGLGLAAAYSIIKMHNGYITAESSIGTGTTFDIYLPASDKEIPVKEETSFLKGRGKILVMDDDRMLREMAKEMLELLGYETEFAKDGSEAIEIYSKAKKAEKPYDAVILDLSIPGGMGGKEAVMRLLELDPELRAIVCSGYSDDPVMSNYQEYGFKGMMAKPFELKTLSKILNEVLKKPDIEDRTSYIEN